MPTLNCKFLIPVLVVITGVFFREQFQNIYRSFMKDQESNIDDIPGDSASITAETLAKFDGIKEKKLYMAVLGTVYDVSSGPKHYAKGSPYHYFVGKDGSRALVTGDFADESENKDHVLDLPCSDFLTLRNWRDVLKKKYKVVGILAGRYYDNYGRSTAYSMEFTKKITECLEEKEAAKNEDLKYPPCNLAWSEEEGTKVWCTKTSGGIHRDWVGVPRQLFTPGVKNHKCVCINMENGMHHFDNIKEYDNCANTSTICYT